MRRATALGARAESTWLKSRRSANWSRWPRSANGLESSTLSRQRGRRKTERLLQAGAKKRHAPEPGAGVDVRRARRCAAAFAHEPYVCVGDAAAGAANTPMRLGRGLPANGAPPNRWLRRPNRARKIRVRPERGQQVRHAAPAGAAACSTAAALRHVAEKLARDGAHRVHARKSLRRVRHRCVPGSTSLFGRRGPSEQPSHTPWRKMRSAYSQSAAVRPTARAASPGSAAACAEESRPERHEHDQEPREVAKEAHRATESLPKERDLWQYIRAVPVQLAEVLATLQRLAPLEFAEPWDNVGLLLERRCRWRAPPR